MQRIIFVIIVSFIVFFFVLIFINSGSFYSVINNEFSSQPLSEKVILAESGISHLPAPVRRYIEYSGAIGKPVPQNFYNDACLFAPAMLIDRKFSWEGIGPQNWL